MFDWRQLQRWGITTQSLPPGSIIRFKELTLWEHYKGQIIAVLTMCGLEALLISLLLVGRAQGRRAKVTPDERCVSRRCSRNFWRN